MARRSLMLAVAGAGLLTALLLARRAQAATSTLDLDANAWVAGVDFSRNTLNFDEIRQANEPTFFEGIFTVTQPDIDRALFLPNVRAFLSMIGNFEGGPEGYNALFGGARFESFADHPRIIVKKSGYASSAAGRYQILAGTWDDIRTAIGAPDFSPYWQDVAAVYLIRRRGALSDVIAGNFDAAITKVAKEWASLPGAGYGQPERALADARQLYANAGGNFA